MDFKIPHYAKQIVISGCFINTGLISLVGIVYIVAA